MSITATYTAETKLLIVNNQTNSTRTSTIKNTEINFANISTPTNTNSAGTVTTSISLYFGAGILTATFPTTTYEDYASTYAFCGTLPTLISGTSTCLTIQSESCSTPGVITSSRLNSNNGVFTFPSHPRIPVGVQTDVDLSLDPRGWTYAAVIAQDCGDQSLIQPLFPDLSFWSCNLTKVCESPAEVLATALFLTVTSTSHEAGLTTSNIGPAALPPATSPGPAASPPASSPGLAALPPASSLAPLLSSQPAPNIASVTQSASMSPPPGVQPASTTQPAQNKQPAPNNLPILTNSIPNKSSYSGNEPASNNQPAPAESATTSPLPVHQAVPNNQPAPNDQSVPSNPQGPNDQPAPSQPAHNPPSPPSATIVPIAVASTNAQGSVVVSTTLAAAIAVLQTSTNNQGQSSVFTNFLPLTPNAPVTLIPQIVTSTNAQGSVILATSNAVPVPIVITSTNPQGKAITTTSTKSSPVALNPAASPIAFIPTTITTTNAQGMTTVSTATAAIIPIVASSTNSQGQLVLSSSLLTAAATASANVVVSYKNPQGSITSSTTQVQAVILTTTNAQGSQILTTSPIVPPPAAFTTPPPITIGTQVITPNAQSEYILPSETLTAGGMITVSGIPISLAPSATALVIGTSTQQPVNGATTPPTLTPGGLITISGTPIALAPSATALIIGSNTIPLGSSPTLPPALTIGSQVFPANSATQYIIGSQTLTPGGVITVSGTRVSLAPGDTAAVVGTSTEGLGPLITAGLGSGPGLSKGNGTPVSTGGARAVAIPGFAVWLEGILMLLGLVMVVGL